MIFGFRTRKELLETIDREMKMIEDLKYHLKQESEQNKQLLEDNERLRKENKALNIGKEFLIKENDRFRESLNAIFEEVADVKEMIRE